MKHPLAFIAFYIIVGLLISTSIWIAYLGHPFLAYFPGILPSFLRVFEPAVES